MSGADGESNASLVPCKVRYAKPPEDSRFKKGNSGNPNDFFIDLVSGNIEVEGPMNDKQKAVWDVRVRRMT